MNFSDYLASAITPQMTLLEKFNALLEYLKTYEYENAVLYTHTFTLKNKNNQSISTLMFIDGNKNQYENNIINSSDFVDIFKNSVTCKYGGGVVISIKYLGGITLYAYSVPQIYNISMSDFDVIGQTVEKYQGE